MSSSSYSIKFRNETANEYDIRYTLDEDGYSGETSLHIGKKGTPEGANRLSLSSNARPLVLRLQLVGSGENFTNVSVNPGDSCFSIRDSGVISEDAGYCDNIPETPPSSTGTRLSRGTRVVPGTGGSAKSGNQALMWILIAILVIAIIVFLMRRRRSAAIVVE